MLFPEEYYDMTLRYVRLQKDGSLREYAEEYRIKADSGSGYVRDSSTGKWMFKHGARYAVNILAGTSGPVLTVVPDRG